MNDKQYTVCHNRGDKYYDWCDCGEMYWVIVKMLSLVEKYLTKVGILTDTANCVFNYYVLDSL